MIKTKEPSPEMTEASRRSGFRPKRRSWRVDEITESHDLSSPNKDAVDTEGADPVFLLSNPNITERLDNKQVTFGEQSGNKQVTFGEQSGNKQVTAGVHAEHTDNNRIPKPITGRVTISEQSGNKQVTNASFSELVGLQKKVVLLVYESCKISRSAISAPLTLESMSEALGSPKGSIKTTTNRLRRKHVIQTVEQKEGRGGFTRYRLNDHVFQEVAYSELVNKRITIGEQTDNNWISKPITQPVTSASSSSSFVLEEQKEATTQLSKLNLGPEWEEINYQPLHDLKVYFGKPQLKQIFDDHKLSASEVQESINRFVFDLIHNDKRKSIRSNEISFFMGMLRKGIPYACPPNYESPEEKLLREYTEQEEAYAARIAQVRERLFQLEFEKWQATLSPIEIRNCLPDLLRDFKSDSAAVQSMLKDYFRSSHWANLLQEKIKSFQLEVKSELPITTKEDEVLTTEQVRALADAQFGSLEEI